MLSKLLPSETCGLLYGRSTPRASELADNARRDEEGVARPRSDWGPT